MQIDVIRELKGKILIQCVSKEFCPLMGEGETHTTRTIARTMLGRASHDHHSSV